MDEPPGPTEFLSKSASAHDHLKRLAVRGLLRPGRRLAPNDIAREFSTSITPVRDALARLAAEGFILAEPNRGYFTKRLSVTEQRDLNELLLVHHLCCLEPQRPSVAEALRRSTVALDELAAHPPVAPGPVALAIEEVYAELARASGNLALLTAVRNAADRTHHLRRLDCEAAEGRAAQLSGLGDILRAVRADHRIQAFSEARRMLEALSARLPALLDTANAASQQLKFP